ncbi:MAG: hypothetical protein FD129_720 [bacterium]|nr:MAG: hypothetical protein FD129_720 [bacterium]
MRALVAALGASLAAVLAVVLVVTLVAPSRSVTGDASAEEVRGESRAASATSTGAITTETVARQAGSLAGRIRAAGDGHIIFRYDTWPDVTGDENGNLNRGNQFHGEFNFSSSRRGGDLRDHGEWTTGPMTAVLSLRQGLVTRMKIGIDETRWHDGDVAADLGQVSTGEAARYLLQLASTTTRDGLGEDAIVAAVFVRDGDVWDELFRIARDTSRPDEVRSSALFWIGQEAGDRATPELVGVAEDEGDSDIRESAVFALSQRPESEAIPSLTRLARTSRHADVRKSALFWLAQHDDPKVIDFFEELLAGD